VQPSLGFSSVLILTLAICDSCRYVGDLDCGKKSSSTSSVVDVDLAYRERYLYIGNLPGHPEGLERFAHMLSRGLLVN